MRILDALIESLSGTDIPVRTVCVGAFWTVVTSRFSGMATTYRDLDLCHADHPCMVKDAGTLVEKSARELVEYARADDTVSASIGMAAINSLIELDESTCLERGAFDLLAGRARGKNIAVVGHFPFIPRLRSIARNLWVIEKRVQPGDLPESEASRILPQCDVVSLTGTAFINHTLEQLLEHCRGSYVVLTGPTSPLSPVLFDHGIDAICGTRVVDPEEVIRYSSQGATFRQIHGHGVRLLTMLRDQPIPGA